MKKVGLDIGEDVKKCRPHHSCYCDLEELQSLPWTSFGLLCFLEWFRIGWHTRTLSLAYFCGNLVLHIETKLHRNSCCLSYATDPCSLSLVCFQKETQHPCVGLSSVTCCHSRCHQRKKKEMWCLAFFSCLTTSNVA